jgi:hypothetical protein
MDKFISTMQFLGEAHPCGRCGFFPGGLLPADGETGASDHVAAIIENPA